MGFEISLHVVATSDTDYQDYRLKVGSFDLCCVGSSAIALLHSKGVCESLPAAMSYGDNTTSEDSYGEQLWAHPIADVIKALEADTKKDAYWRFQVALDILRSMQDNWAWFGVPCVITFGH